MLRHAWASGLAARSSDEVKRRGVSAAVGLMLIDSMGISQQVKPIVGANDVTKKLFMFTQKYFRQI